MKTTTIAKSLSAAILTVLATGCSTVGGMPSLTGLSMSTGGTNQTTTTDKNPVAFSGKKSEVATNLGPARAVTGIDGVEGEIFGTPVKGSHFDKLQIGMPLATAQRIVGEPDDSGAYLTAKGFIPGYSMFGKDGQRMELAYKGKGRLFFAMGGFSGAGQLIRIENNASDSGVR